MKVRIITNEKDAPSKTEEVETSCQTLAAFLLEDMAAYLNIKELMADFDHAELNEKSAILHNSDYEHIYTVIA